MGCLSTKPRKNNQNNQTEDEDEDCGAGAERVRPVYNIERRFVMPRELSAEEWRERQY